MGAPKSPPTCLVRLRAADEFYSNCCPVRQRHSPVVLATVTHQQQPLAPSLPPPPPSSSSSTSPQLRFALN